MVTLDFNQRHATYIEVREANPKRRLDLPKMMTIAAVTVRGDVSETKAAFRFFTDGGATGGQIRLSSGDLQSTIEINWLNGNIAFGDGAQP